MIAKKSAKTVDKNHDKTTGLYKIAAKIMKKVKTGSSFKTQLYQAQYPNKLLLNAVLMNVFKWEKVIDILVEKTKILEKENNMDPELVYVLITELMWSKFGLKGNAKNILAIKKYKNEFSLLMKESELVKLTASIPTKVSKPRFFRVNTLVTTLDDILKKLSQQKFNKLETPKTYAEFLELIKSDKFNGNTFVQDVHIKELLVFNSKVKFYKLEEYNNGSLIVQDKASCLAAYLLNPEPESNVLDMCAAPGMKTSHLAAIMQNKGKLYAVDRCKDRFNIMLNMLEKYGVKNVETFNMDALTFPYYDDVKYILVDPSCSGSGIVDRVRNDSAGQNENLKIRLKKLANVHAQLLNHALKSYPKLERLVYSTCSANHEENEAVVDEALSVNGKFKLLNCSKMVKGWINKGASGYDCSEMCLNAVPNIDCTNGFFIAVFVRRDFEEEEILTEEASEVLEDPKVIDKQVSDVIDEKITKDNKPRMETDENTPKTKKGNKNKKKKSLKNLENSELGKKKKKDFEEKDILKEESSVVIKDIEVIDKQGSDVINEKITKDNKPKMKTDENAPNTKKSKKNKKIKSIQKLESLDHAEKEKTYIKLENSELGKKRKREEEIKSSENAKKKKLVKLENLEPSKKKKPEVIENPVSTKKIKSLVQLENSEQTTKKKTEKKIENSAPPKTSQNIKRRERRLKLENANGVTLKTKKSKKKKENV